MGIVTETRRQRETSFTVLQRGMLDTCKVSAKSDLSYRNQMALFLNFVKVSQISNSYKRLMTNSIVVRKKASNSKTDANDVKRPQLSLKQLSYTVLILEDRCPL